MRDMWGQFLHGLSGPVILGVHQGAGNRLVGQRKQLGRPVEEWPVVWHRLHGMFLCGWITDAPNQFITPRKRVRQTVGFQVREDGGNRQQDGGEVDLAPLDLVFKTSFQYLILPNLAQRRRAPEQILWIHQ